MDAAQANVSTKERILEGSGFVLEGLEEKGLNAKSNIQVR